MLEEESECAVVSFDSELSGGSAPTQYMGVCERCLALEADEGWAVLSFASVDMNSPRHFEGVSPSCVWCC